MNNVDHVPRLFITGTDTNVGKTHLTCLIANQMRSRGKRVAAYKPVCSGAIISAAQSPSPDQTTIARWDDIERIKAAVGGNWSDEVICPQRFLAPLAPPVAAALEGRTVNFQRAVDGVLKFNSVDLLLIEGAGGWLAPVTETKCVADLGLALKAPILIVARAGLGTINHTLLTVESIRARGLTVAGIVLNEVTLNHDDQSTQTNGDEIAARCGAPVLGTIPHGNCLELHQRGRPVTINWPDLAMS